MFFYNKTVAIVLVLLYNIINKSNMGVFDMTTKIHPSEVDNSIEFGTFTITQEMRNNVLNMSTEMPQRQLRRRRRKVS